MFFLLKRYNKYLVKLLANYLVINSICLFPSSNQAFAGAISTGVPNTLWRIRRSIFTVAPPFIIAYLIYDAAEKENKL